MVKKPETLFKEKVLADLKALPLCYAEKIQQKAKRATPDILACVGGYFVALELKTLTGRLDELQRYKLEKIKKAGGIALVVTPENWNTIKKELENLATSPVKHSRALLKLQSEN